MRSYFSCLNSAIFQFEIIEAGNCRPHTGGQQDLESLKVQQLNICCTVHCRTKLGPRVKMRIRNFGPRVEFFFFSFVAQHLFDAEFYLKQSLEKDSLIFSFN